MDMVFVRQGEYLKGDQSFPLIRKCFSLYSAGRAFDAEPEIKRDDRGRLYFVFDGTEDSTVDLSITHSGDIWMCMISDRRCGIDFQYVRNAEKQGISDRFFGEGEQAYIENGGNFFDVWCRKEALGKYMGGGFFDNADTCPGGTPAGEMVIEGQTIYIRNITQEMLKKAGIDTASPSQAAYISETGVQPDIVRI